MTSATPTQRLRTLWAVLGTAGRVAVVAGALAIVVLLVSLRSLTGAFLTSAAPSGAEVTQDQKQQAERFAKGFDNYIAQIDGRSLFFIPSPPRKESQRVATDDAPPKPPTRYGGPALVGFANDTAYFADGRKLKVGDETDSTLTIKRLEAPWSAVVVWQGAEFTVGLFDRDRLVFPTASAPATESAKPEATEPALEGPPAPPVDAKATPPAPTSADAKSPPPADPPKTASRTEPTVPPGTSGGPA